MLLAAMVASACGGTTDPPYQPLEFMPQTYVAEHSLPAFGGILLGTDRGEWGGELFFERPGGDRIVLLKENVQGIIRHGGKVLVFTGLDHLGSSTGNLYEVSDTNGGAPGLKHLGYLPGTPSNVEARRDGSVFFLVSGARFARDGRPVLDCYELTGTSIRSSNQCAPPPQLGSNSSSKPTPLRGAA